MDNVIDLSQGRPVQTQQPQQTPQRQPQEVVPGHDRGPLFVTAIVFLILAVLACVGAFVGYMLLCTAPADFVPKAQVEVISGESVHGIATALANAHVIRSPEAFQWFVRLRGDGTKLREGLYVFENPIPLSKVLDRLVSGAFGSSEQLITIPEGYTRKDMAKTFAAALPGFDQTVFMNDTATEEGYLFPDTYRFFVNATSGKVETDLRKNFAVRTASLKKEADASGKNWNDIIKVASLVELEGKTKTDREMIADIIYRRLEQNVPLQLDAPFLYFMNKGSLQLTSEDLFSQSPYNTYRNRGLPPTPIANPGLESIDAAMHPLANDFLYYLSDAKGVVHYAKTFDEHKSNKKQYLGK